METDNPEFLDVWRARRTDFVDFEVLPVITSSTPHHLLTSVPEPRCLLMSA
jgi:hypothetical protein